MLKSKYLVAEAEQLKNMVAPKPWFSQRWSFGRFSQLIPVALVFNEEYEFHTNTKRDSQTFSGDKTYKSVQYENTFF